MIVVDDDSEGADIPLVCRLCVAVRAGRPTLGAANFGVDLLRERPGRVEYHRAVRGPERWVLPVAEAKIISCTP